MHLEENREGIRKGRKRGIFSFFFGSTPCSVHLLSSIKKRARQNVQNDASSPIPREKRRKH